MCWWAGAEWACWLLAGKMKERKGNFGFGCRDYWSWALVNYKLGHKDYNYLKNYLWIERVREEWNIDFGNYWDLMDYYLELKENFDLMMCIGMGC